jgi:hypothetical protein
MLWHGAARFGYNWALDQVTGNLAQRRPDEIRSSMSSSTHTCSDVEAGTTRAANGSPTGRHGHGK